MARRDLAADLVARAHDRAPGDLDTEELKAEQARADEVLRRQHEILMQADRERWDLPQVQVELRRLPEGQVDGRQGGDVEAVDLDRVDVRDLVDPQRLDRERVDVVEFLDVDGGGRDLRDPQRLDVLDLIDPDLVVRGIEPDQWEIGYVDVAHRSTSSASVKPRPVVVGQHHLRLVGRRRQTLDRGLDGHLLLGS